MNLDKVIGVLSAMQSLFEKHKVGGYDLLVKNFKERLQIAQSPDAVALVFSDIAQPGMGSLSDVYISRNNGNQVDDEKGANNELRELMTKLYFAMDEYRKEKLLKVDMNWFQIVATGKIP